jgi:hypothetical protein
VKPNLKNAGGRAPVNGAGKNGAPATPPLTGPIFDASAIEMQRRMRVNPLPMLDPQNYGMWLDQFDAGMLRQASLVWEAMAKRDDTLISVKPALENVIASKGWQVLKKKGAPEPEASRHAAAIQYFYDNCSAVDAFDRNERGKRFLMLQHMMRAESFKYALQHFVWKPQPGKMIEVEGAQPVPALTAELEYVPLWFFENTTGTMRFLPMGGFGAQGTTMDFEGEWMCTTGRGIMFAAGICVTFKRLTFQDWTIYNERYAQAKVVGKTNATKESKQGQAMEEVVSAFNGDMGVVLYETPPGEKSPIELLGPEGTTSVDIFERFLDRQDRKMTVMYRGSDLRNMSREKDTTGVSAQTEETEAIELAAVMMIAGTCQEHIDRPVIRFCFGEGVEPLAYFGLPDIDTEDAQQLRESAGFLADRRVRVKASSIADRLGIETLGEQENDEDLLQPITKVAAPGATPDSKPAEDPAATANSRPPGPDSPALGRLLAVARHAWPEALAGDLQPLRTALEEVLQGDDATLLQRAQALAVAMRAPAFIDQIVGANGSELALFKILSAACATGLAEQQPGATGNAGDVPGHPFHGNQHTGGEGGGESRPSRAVKAQSISEVLAASKTGAHAWTDYADVSAEEAVKLKARTGQDFTGYKHLLDSGETRKIIRDHGEDARPITEEDFHRLPEYLASAQSSHISTTHGKPDRIVHVTHDEQHRIVVIEEIRTGREKLALKTMYRP